MRREKYVFNTSTLQYEKEQRSFKQRLPKILGLASLVILCSFGLYTAAYTIIPTPKELAMERELGRIEYQFSSLTSDFEKISSQLELLHNKDTEVHRMIFGMDPIDEAIWDGGTGGSEQQQYFTSVTNSFLL